MAFLGSKNGIYVEVKYDRFVRGSIYYSFKFFLGEKPLFNPDVLWGTGNIECEDYGHESIIGYFEEFLEGKINHFWFPDEDDISIGITQSGFQKDWYEVSFEPSSYKFDMPRRQDGDYGEGAPIIRIYSYRDSIEKFIEELKVEYQEFLLTNREVMEQYDKEMSSMRDMSKDIDQK